MKEDRIKYLENAKKEKNRELAKTQYSIIDSAERNTDFLLDEIMSELIDEWENQYLPENTIGRNLVVKTVNQIVRENLNSKIINYDESKKGKMINAINKYNESHKKNRIFYCDFFMDEQNVMYQPVFLNKLMEVLKKEGLNIEVKDDLSLYIHITVEEFENIIDKESLSLKK